MKKRRWDPGRLGVTLAEDLEARWSKERMAEAEHRASRRRLVRTLRPKRWIERLRRR